MILTIYYTEYSVKKEKQKMQPARRRIVVAQGKKGSRSYECTNNIKNYVKYFEYRYEFFSIVEPSRHRIGLSKSKCVIYTSELI